MRDELQSIENDDTFEGVDLSLVEPLINEISEVESDIEKLKGRFSRKTLNIGVVGRMRQGKSQLLQSMTGLDDISIPTSSGQATTGAKSAIQNITEDNTYADVYFYSKKEILQDVIQLYFDELHLDFKPKSIEQFKKFNFGDVKAKIEGAGNITKLERLEKYQTKLENFEKNLNSSAPLRIEKENIKKYIAQFNPEDSEEDYSDYLSVKEVRIFTKFPKSEVGDIVFVDMPGLGEVTIGDDKRMIKALSEEVDIVLFVRFPSSTGDDWKDTDIELYDRANSAIDSLNIKDWSFMVLNKKDDNSNATNCETLKNTMLSRNIEVSETKIINAYDGNIVNNELLPSVLDYMMQNLKNLDEVYTHSIQRKIDKIRKKIEDSNFLSDSNLLDTKGNRLLNENFNIFFTQLAEDLGKYEEVLFKDKNLHNELIGNKFNEIIKKIKSSYNKLIPEEREIDFRSSPGSYTEFFLEYLKIARNGISSYFSEIQDDLNILTDSVKKKVIEIFNKHNEYDFSFLGSDIDVFFESIISILEQDQAQFKNILSSFISLRDFRLTYRGWIQPRIQKHLSLKFDPDAENSKWEINSSAIVVKDILTATCDAAIYEIETELEEFMWEPSMACYSMLFDFKNRLIDTNAKEEWRNFTCENKEKIWGKSFARLAKITKIKELSKTLKFELSKKNKMEEL